MKHEMGAQAQSAGATTASPVSGEEKLSDEHGLQWAINRAYQIEATFQEEDTATSRNDSKAILLLLEHIDQTDTYLASLSAPTRAELVENRRAVREALEVCAADFISEPCTLADAYQIVGKEFSRRQMVARAALQSPDSGSAGEK